MPNYLGHDGECQSCGSTLADRDAFGQRNAGALRTLSECKFCGATKCCMCDMGDDVECGSCDPDCEEGN